ncbi:PREDICTED: variable charge X-linked protein 3B-like [Trachymyrmex cornetzi]|uniref:variable charge X-linked protein 3B-like n=1 Tax=Trachymyrmex cornetzi TaxID=471704 RepID=UPI00084F49C0|nr:PREDICTED: variable charge X-linked protein 3B-like [Trachymyrmex cornetzi]
MGWGNVNCDPNPVKKKRSKLSSITPARRLHYILPKVEIVELEYLKVMATECNKENRENISCIQDSVFEEPVIKEARIEEPVIKKSIVDEVMLEKTEVEKPMLQEGTVEALMPDDTIEEPFIKNTQESFLEDLNKNECTKCLLLTDKVQKLEGKLEAVEEKLEAVMKQKSCNQSDISDNSSFHHEELSQRLSTSSRAIRNDHCYVSTPQSLQQKLDFLKAKAIRMKEQKRNIVKKFRRSMIKVSQLKDLMKSMKKKKIK